MKEKIWLSSPHMGGNELKYIHQAFEENWVAPLVPNVNGFEEDLQHFLGNGVKVSALSAITIDKAKTGFDREDQRAPVF